MIIGALAFASIFAFAQRAGEGTGDSSETERRFWGNQIVGVASCVPTTPFPDGSPRFIKTWIVEYVSGRPSTSCLSLIEFLALSQRKEYDKARRGTAFG